MLKKIRSYGNLVMFSHSLFSLPFGGIAMLWAAGGLPEARTLVLIVLALLFARNGANCFNRVADRKIDAKNPRTANRPLQTGAVSAAGAWGLTIFCFAGLAVCAALLNRLCLALLPLAIFVFVFYSYSKRLTWLCHWILGLACGGACAGAWAAVRGSLELAPFALGGAVCFWVAGFDIIYALQDVDFDRKERLHSVPERFGAFGAKIIAALSHAAAVCALLVTAWFIRPGALYFAGVAAVALLLAAEHYMVFTGRKITFIAYGMNQIVSVTFFMFAVTDWFFRVFLR